MGVSTISKGNIFTMTNKSTKPPTQKTRTKRDNLSTPPLDPTLLRENIEKILEKFEFPEETRREIFSKLKSFLDAGAEKPQKGTQND